MLILNKWYLTLFISLLFQRVVFSILPCLNSSELVYSPLGYLSFGESFLKCLENVGDPIIFPGVLTNSQITVKIQFYLSSLIRLNEIESSASISFGFSQFWYDPRLDMPSLWSNLSTSVQSQGVDITRFLSVNDVNSGNVPNIWLPDITFPDAVSLTVTQQAIRIFPIGINWVQYFVATFQENSFTYESYPNDIQNIQMKFASLSVNTSDLNIELGNPSIVLMKDKNNNEIIKKNSVWSYKNIISEVYDARIDPIHYRSTGLITMVFERQSHGLVMRLGIPIMLMTLLSGLIFWSDITTRADSTTTLLLTVSALYIVIFANIPMLGYLTAFDNFVLYMFGILFACVVIHQITSHISANEITKHPLKQLLICFFELIGRCFIIPIIIGLFFQSFRITYPLSAFIISIVLIIIYFIILIPKEFFKLNNELKIVKIKILNKIKLINTNNNNNLTKMEILFYNIIFYNKISFQLIIEYNLIQKFELNLNKQNNNVNNNAGTNIKSNRISNMNEAAIAQQMGQQE